MTTRNKIVLILVVLGATFGLGRCKRIAISGPKLAVPAVLPLNDTERIVVDPVKHTLIIVKPMSNQTLRLPDRSSVIDVHKDGSVQVTSPQYGWEHMAFMGVQGSEYFRVAAGMDAFYFKKLDVGMGVADRIGEYTPIVFAQVSYNVWSNCRVGIEYGTDRLLGGTITVRL